MRRIPTDKCKPGMTLAKPVFNDLGLVLIGKDIELTATLINRLIQLGVNTVYIHDPRTDDIVIEDALSDKTREMALKSIKQTFETVFKERLQSRPPLKKDLYSVFKPVLENILTDIKSNNQAMLMLSSIYVKDLYLYTHSLNVALYSIAMGIANSYNQQQLLELGLGALLHDLGKTEVPMTILEKNGPLTDEEFAKVKKHTTFGFDILRKEFGIPLLSAHCAFQHHERINGGGYPRGIKDKEIHDFAKVVAISDVYDALTSERVYRDPILPHEAMDYLHTKAGIEFDRDWLEIFKKTIAIYPIGINVTLSSGESGIVVDVNSKFPDRPIVRVLEEKDKGSLDDYYEIDLSKELTKVIIQCGCS